MSNASWIVRLNNNYAEPLESLRQAAQLFYVVVVFCLALFLGALKALVVGPVAGLLLIIGNIGVVLGLFPFHVSWTLYSLVKTNRINLALKFALLLALPIFFALWLVLSISGSVLVGVGYGFFTPWISTFEAFRQDSEVKKFQHSLVDGTWGTIKGSCTVVRDFADICYHSYPLYLKELRESAHDRKSYSIRFKEIPACILTGLIGVVVDLPLYTAIAVIKSPYMLFKGWQRLLHDLISREGPFLETACIPIAGLVILLWPLVVLGCIILTIISSIFVGLYGSVIVYQERSFQRGVAYVIAMVSEFDEYTNDWLYLREGSILPKPRYRTKKPTHSEDIGATSFRGVKDGIEAPAMFVPSLAPSRSVREAIQEVKMVQIWEELMMNCETSGKELIDANVIGSTNLGEWMQTKGSSQEIVGLGILSHAFLHSMMRSIRAGARGMLLRSGLEVTQMNRPEDRLLDWFFMPVSILREQIRVIKMTDEELLYLEKLLLFRNGDNSSKGTMGNYYPHQDPLRAAQIQAISRRLVGMMNTISKFPTFRRRFRQVVKTLILYAVDKEGGPGSSVASRSNRSLGSTEIVPAEV